MHIRDIRTEEHALLGQMMVEVYSQLDGFPKPFEQPAYYDMLANIGAFTSVPRCRVLVAMTPAEELLGGVVYFGDMRSYGSGGTATQEVNASGIRLLGVHPNARGRGVGRQLSLKCIELAQEQKHQNVVLHTTEPMRAAWALYTHLGFARAPDLDFMQGALPVFGFRLALERTADRQQATARTYLKTS